MNCSIPNHENKFKHILDPEGYYAGQWHAESHGCTCKWKFITNPDKGNCNWGHGYNRRIEDVNCPFHKVT